MSVSRFAARRPVLTVMVTLIVVVVGITAMARLPVDLMPDISFPSLSISTSYSNTSPDIIEQLITRPVEEAMSAVPGVEEIYSSSSEGSSNVHLSFAWGTDLEAASNDVRDRLDRVIPRLPSDADRPRLFKFDVASAPVLSIGASGALDPLVLRQMVDEQVVYRLERVPGVAAVDIWGGTRREVRVNLLLERLKALQIPVDQIVSRIRSGNVEQPVGSVYRGNQQVNVRASGVFASPEDLRATVIAVRDGVPVRLGQIAEVGDAVQDVTRIARINGQPGIQISISKQSGKNTVEVARAVRREVERINQDLPQIRLTVLNDSSQYIRYSINNVGSAALYGGLIALLVLLFFLRHLGSTAVIATSIPVSIVATFALMYFSRFTLNMMSLGGLALGVGMLLDNSIVVLENIFRYRENGMEPMPAAVQGSEEVSSAVTASTLTTLVVFLPLIFVRGMAGVMYQQLALVISFALGCSLLASLTLVPMLSARFLHLGRAGAPRRRFAPIGRALAALERSYDRLLRFTLDRRGLVLSGVLLALLVCLLLTPLLGNELLPATDQGQVRINASLERGTRLEVTDEKFRTVIEPIVLAAVPEAETIVSNVGGSSGQISINLKPKAQRGRSDEQIASDLRDRLALVPGVQIRARTGQGFFMLRLGGRGGTERVQIEIRGHDLATADELAARVQAAVERVDGITDAQVSRETGNPEQHLIIDRGRAADLNITPQQVTAALQAVISGAQAGSFRQGGSEYPIVVRLLEAEQMSLDQMLGLPIFAAEDRPVVLGSLVRAETRSGPARIERRDQERVITVSANTDGRSMGPLVRDAREAIRSVAVPRDFSVVLSGDYAEQQQANRELAISIALAVLLVYMVMAAQFESLRDPFIVMFSIPLAVIGVILMLLATGTAFNMQSGIGALMLGGIVVNNAILLVDHANLLRRRDGLALRRAVEEAGRHRLRPILMTALTTTFGLLPLALGLGEGGEVQAPLARTVIGGLLSASFITLLVVPAVYFILEGRRERRQERRALRRAGGQRVLPLFPFLLAALGLLAARPARAAEGAAAGEPLRLSVREAVLMALENNISLSVQRLAPSIRQMAEREERGAFDPALSAGISAGESLESGGGFEPEVTGSAGATVFLPSGTTAAAALRVSPRAGVPGGYSAGLDVTVTQSLLRGAGSGVNLARVRQARLDTLGSRYEVKGVTESLVASTERTYWDLYLAREQAGIYRESLRLAEQHLADTRERIELGELPEIELAASQAEVALRREALLNAEAGREKTRLQLLRLINPPGGNLWDRPVELVDRPEPPEDRMDEISAHVELGRRLRADLNQARLAAQRGELEVARTRNGLLPKLDLYIGLGLTGLADSFAGAFGEMPGGPVEAAGGLSFSFPLGDRAAGARYERAAATRGQLEESLRNLEQLVEVDVRTAYIDVNRTREQIRSTAVTRELQEQKLRAETEKFRVGRSTTYLVAQAQRDLLAARLSEAEAVAGHLGALINLYRLEGSLLERRGLEVPGLEPAPEP